MQNYITIQDKVRRSAGIGRVFVPIRSAPTA